MLTPLENEVLTKLGEAWTAYCRLPRDFDKGGHHEDQADFRYHIHRLQDLVASRPTYRDMRMESKNGDY